jgi:hypothetical protein
VRDQAVRKPLTWRTPRAVAAMASRAGRGVEWGHAAEPEWPVSAAPGMTRINLDSLSLCRTSPSWWTGIGVHFVTTIRRTHCLHAIRKVADK